MPIYGSKVTERVSADYPGCLSRAVSMVGTSRFVTGNLSYANVAKSATFDVDMGSDEINAFAGREGSQLGIWVMGGLVHWMTAAAVVATELVNGTSVGRCRKMLSWMCRYRETVNASFVSRMCRKFGISTEGYFTQKLDSMLTLMFSAIVAHELGHLCLGHVERMDGGVDMFGADRNDERQADLFAASVLQSFGSGRNGAVAAVMTFASLSYSRGDIYDGEFTHPGDRERIQNMLNAFAADLDGGKPSAEDLRKLL